jgi:hypothetical protein
MSCKSFPHPSAIVPNYIFKVKVDTICVIKSLSYTAAVFPTVRDFGVVESKVKIIV